MNNPVPKFTITRAERAIEQALVKNELLDLAFFNRIVKNWEVIVGEPLSQKTSPAKLVKNELIISVKDAAYAHHLRFFKKKIIELIASPEICGDGVVRFVRFQVGPLTIRKQETERPIAEGETIPQVSNKIMKETETCSEEITDKDLRKKFSGFMSKILAKKNAKKK